MTTPGRPAVDRAPWRTLAVGLALALCTIAGIGAYTFAEIRRLRDEQTAISERNRRDALQLLRIQNDLASLAGLMRDMVDGTEPYPLTGWRPAFDRIRRDLDEATRLERDLAPAAREPAQQARLTRSLEQFWADLDRAFDTAATNEDEARRVVRTSLVAQHRALDSLIARFLVANNQVQEEAAQSNRAVYDRVGREILLLVGTLLLITGAVGVWVVRANRRAFSEVAALGAQLRHLSWRMLGVQEDVQRSLSRELHDDFGQIATAIGTLLGRVRRRFPADAVLAEELDQVRQIAQQALDRIRSRSQWLHPGVLDDFGLERALERCVERFQHQSGVRTHLSVTGSVAAVREEAAIHVYRIVQEALSNVARHSGAGEAWVRIASDNGLLAVEVEDHGAGIGVAEAAGREPGSGMGLVSMRERAELIGGELHVRRAAPAGTIVQLEMREHVPAARPEVA
jgi:signal transduction histidine kinase